MRSALLAVLLAASAPVPPQTVYAEALSAAADARRIRIAEGDGTADLQARLDRKAGRVAEALRITRQLISDLPYGGRSFGHRLVAEVLVDLAEDLVAVAPDRARRYREEAAVAFRLCASFDDPPAVQADCRAKLQALEQPDVPSILASHRDGLDRCLKEAARGGKVSWTGTLKASVGAKGVESAHLEPAPAGRLAPLGTCVVAWARTLPLPGPLDVEVPLVLRSAE